MEGTWASGAPPAEFVVFTLCDQLKITPRQLREEISMYEQRFLWDFYQLRWEHENAEMESAKSQSQARMRR